MNVVFDQIASEDQLVGHLIPKILSFLSAAEKPFCLWLRGELGAGKTTLAGKLLHGLGVPANIPVLSPTFTYMTEYKTASGLIAHLDLYRMVEGDVDSVATLLADRTFVGLVVEWPERCPQAAEIAPTLILDISFAGSDARSYRLSKL